MRLAPSKRIPYVSFSFHYASHPKTQKKQSNIFILAKNKELGYFYFVGGTVFWQIVMKEAEKHQYLGGLQYRRQGPGVNELSRFGRSVLECMEILSLAF